MSTLSLRTSVKARKTPQSRLLYALAVAMRRFSMPVIPGFHRLLYRTREALILFGSFSLRTLWYTPLFQSRLEAPAPGLFLYGGMPLVMGPVKIRVGRNCRISGQTTLSGRSASRPAPLLVVGDNCDIGWQTTIAVGTKIVLGNNVRIAGRAFLAGYPGHPLDAAARASGAPDEQSQARDIVLEDDVWLATGVTVAAGVRIGKGTVVAAGSVVTKDLGAGVLAAGVPAKALRALNSRKDTVHV